MLLIRAVLVLLTARFSVADEAVHSAIVREVHNELTMRDKSALPEFLHVEFEIDETPVSLTLRRNHNVNLNRPIHFLGNTNVHVPDLENMGLYQDIENGAAISVLVLKEGENQQDHVRTLEGSFNLGDLSYAIEPDSKTLNNIVGDDVERRSPKFNDVSKGQQHKIYRIPPIADSKYGNFERDTLNIPASENPQRLRKLQTRRSKKERSTAPVNYYVELGFVLDHTIWEYFLDKANNDVSAATIELKKHYSHIINGMDLAFKSIDAEKWGYRIIPVLKDYIIAETRENSTWVVDNTYEWYFGTAIDPYEALLRLSVLAGKLASEQPGRFDHLMGFTRYLLGGPVGLAYVNSICIPDKSVSIVDDRVFFSSQVAAHELAHSLGAWHDEEGNSCGANEKDIMYYRATEYAYKFSDCSARYFNETLTEDSTWRPNGKCLENAVCDPGAPKADNPAPSVSNTDCEGTEGP